MADAKIEKALEELRKVTGLAVTVPDVPAGAEEEVAAKLGALAAAYREKYDKSAYLRHLLSGDLSESELLAQAARFHIRDDVPRRIYVIECTGGSAEEAERVLKNLFVTASSDQFVRIDDRTGVLIKAEKDGGDDAEAENLAHTIVDMLGAEALTAARVGYAEAAARLVSFPEVYRKARTALVIGSTFSVGARVFHYSALGIGRLIYDLPEESARLFLTEIFGEASPADLDDEMRALIDAFFENNLNISEASRQLYVHRNTLVYRLEKLRAATGLDLRIFEDAVKLKIAMMIDNVLRSRD